MPECELEESVIGWRARGFGFFFADSVACHFPLTHSFWADNIIVFAASFEQVLVMNQELTNVIYEAGFKWKSASLEFMLCGI